MTSADDGIDAVPDSAGQPPAYADLARVLEGLPQILRYERAARGATLREVSAETGLAISALHRLENGQGGIRVDTALAVLRWLDRP